MGLLYFALRPDPDAAEQIADLAERIAFEYELAPPQATHRLHLSLAGVGPFNSDRVAEAVEIGASVLAPSIAVTLDGIARFGGDPTPLVLTIGEPRALQNLHAKLLHAMGKIPTDDGKNFSPHVTMLYDNAVPDHLHLESPIRWIADEFALIHSDSGHEIVATWPLRG